MLLRRTGLRRLIVVVLIVGGMLLLMAVPDLPGGLLVALAGIGLEVWGLSLERSRTKSDPDL